MYYCWNIQAFLPSTGHYRRQLYPSEDCRNDFFDPTNELGQLARQQCLDLALGDVEIFLKNEGGRVAILDASNSTAKRRAQIFDRCKQLGVKTFFIESICEDAEVVHRNVVQVRDQLLTQVYYVEAIFWVNRRCFMRLIRDFCRIFNRWINFTTNDGFLDEGRTSLCFIKWGK